MLFHQTGIHIWTEKAQRDKYCRAEAAARTDRREAGNRHGSLQAVISIHLLIRARQRSSHIESRYGHELMAVSVQYSQATRRRSRAMAELSGEGEYSRHST